MATIKFDHPLIGGLIEVNVEAFYARADKGIRDKLRQSMDDAGGDIPYTGEENKDVFQALAVLAYSIVEGSTTILSPEEAAQPENVDLGLTNGNEYTYVKDKMGERADVLRGLWELTKTS